MEQQQQQQKSGKHNPIKGTKQLLVTNPKEMEIYVLFDKEFKIIEFKSLSELQENTDGQLNKIKKMIHEQNNINKEKLKK